jgi:hypothetical protein
VLERKGSAPSYLTVFHLLRHLDLIHRHVRHLDLLHHVRHLDILHLVQILIFFTMSGILILFTMSGIFSAIVMSGRIFVTTMPFLIISCRCYSVMAPEKSCGV